MGSSDSGSIFRTTGQFEDARKEINLARAAWEGQGHLLAANSALEQLAFLAFDQRVPAESVIFFERMLSNAEQAVGADSPALTAILAQLGRFYLVVGRNDAAENTLARINRLIGKDPPEQAPGFLYALQLKAQLSAENSDVASAETLFLGLSLSPPNIVASRPTLLAQIVSISPLLSRLGDFRRDQELRKGSRYIREKAAKRSPNVGYALVGAAQAYENVVMKYIESLMCRG